ncbi:MAG: GNAT family N-acetyltransferase [Intestinibacter bartlettii]|uniref:GNAT family N-acetyltransferase n=1 Tax=Intestinibacter bartlettii TaxID=261299 RepID=UPI0026F1209C|nr:GNAT family N-acetyltransferase [Intestinibacter bartlettii]MDO5009333.1 GNAT family N-acetyltransferase [Intestinibacter bartlettii]
MIKRLDKRYEKKVIDYLNLEREINTFNLQELKNYGFENVFYKIYSDIDEEGNINGILFKCFEYLTFYAYKEFDIDQFCDFISKLEFSEISGKSSCVDIIAKKLGLLKYRKVHLCRLDNIEKQNQNIDPNLKLRKISIFNIKKIVNLYEQIGEFQNTTIEGLRSNLKSGRGYCIEDRKKVISMAKSTAENKNTAMIIGVGTHPKYRNQGLATKCLVKLCEELLEQGIKPCLFYDNEEAGKLYRKLGFKTIDNWSIYYKN